ncbi:hypothetical protein JTB14_015132 [Gonioctena quinquepunctata]|nr:hypothetical protein JTB14_015132 [Gonioctena quinquepunctata]
MPTIESGFVWAVSNYEKGKLFAEYFHDVHINTTDITEEQRRDTVTTEVIGILKPVMIDPGTLSELITIYDEVKDIINTLPRNKAPGAVRVEGVQTSTVRAFDMLIGVRTSAPRIGCGKPLATWVDLLFGVWRGLTGTVSGKDVFQSTS